MYRSRGISSFDKAVDQIGAKHGYGSGDYVVVPAGDGREFGEDFAQIVSYFAAKRGDRALNKKSDVSPIDLKPYLPWIALFEARYSDAGEFEDALVTLQGSDACGAFTDCTGKLITVAHPPLIAERVLRSMKAVVDTRGAVIGQSEERNMTPPHVQVNIIYVPLTSDGETVTHFFAYARLEKLTLRPEDVDMYKLVSSE